MGNSSDTSGETRTEIPKSLISKKRAQELFKQVKEKGDELVATKEHWDFYKSFDTCLGKLDTYTHENAVAGFGYISNISIEKWLDIAVFREHETAFKWDKTMKELNLLQKVSKKISVWQNIYDPGFIMNKRDMIFMKGWEVDEKTGALYVIAVSSDAISSQVPLKKGLIRTHLNIYYLRLTPTLEKGLYKYDRVECIDFGGPLPERLVVNGLVNNLHYEIDGFFSNKHDIPSSYPIKTLYRVLYEGSENGIEDKSGRLVIHCEVIIDAKNGFGKVWATLIDISKWHTWNTIRTVSNFKGKVEVGKTFELKFDGPGKDATKNKERIVVIDHAIHQFVYEYAEPILDTLLNTKAIYDVEAIQDDKIRVRYCEIFKGPLVFAVEIGHREESILKGSELFFQSLKEVCEGK
jgi:hypothetical protein